MTRFAAQRLLAERPQLKITDELADRINDAVAKLSGEYGGGIVKDVGPVLTDSKGQPLQMVMNLRPGFVADVYNPERYRQQQIGAIPGKGGTVASLITDRPGSVSEIEFGYINPDRFGDISDIKNSKQTDPVLKEQIRQVGYQKLLEEAQLELMERGGIQPGDLLTAAPAGAAMGDYRRALTYMNQGFGIPDIASGLQVAQVQKGGGLSPVQLYRADPDMAGYLKLKEDLSRL